jgi:Tol biopolymer transport system component
MRLPSAAAVPHRARAALVALLTALTTVVLVPGAADSASAVNPGGNGKIVFTRTNQIYTIDPSGSGLAQLTRGDKNYWPRWSPNGRRIAYIHETTTGRRDIWVMNANGSHKQQVTKLGNVQAASWSRDGSTLAFGGGRIGEPLLLRTVRSTTPFGGSTPLLGWTRDATVLETQWVQSGPTAWSPDGSAIFFYSTSFLDIPGHYILRYDVSRREVTTWIASGGACCGRGSVSQPAVSADGTRVAMTYDAEAPLIRMSRYPTWRLTLFATKPQDEQLAFAPDGRRVALMNDASGGARIYLASANGTGRTLLTNGYQPDWQSRPQD